MFREIMMISRDIMEQQVMVVISMVVLGNIFCNADLYEAFLRPKSNVDHVVKYTIKFLGEDSGTG